MTDENVQEVPVSETPTELTTVESAPTSAPVPEKKKRGRKPKSATPPPPPIVVEVAPKTRKRRPVPVKLTKSERALQAAVEAAEVDRIKAIDSLAKLREALGMKQSTMDSLDWKLAMLTGKPVANQTQPQVPGYPLPSMYPQSPAYPPSGAPTFVPPSMRTPQLPVEPRANGGSEGIVDDGIQSDQEDQFLTNTGAVGGRGWQ